MRSVDVDIDEVLQDVAGALQERETGRGQSYRSEVREVEDIIYLLPGAWQNITDSLLALDQSLATLEGATADEELPLRKRAVEKIKGITKRFIQKSVYWYVNPVVAQLHRMHAATDRALHGIADQLTNINSRLEVLEKANVSGRISTLEGERFDERISRIERAWRQRVTEALTTSPTGAQELSPVDSGAFSEIQQRGILKDGSMERVKSFPPFNFDYYWFESIHRGDRELIKRRQHPYLRYFKGCENVLDIGCGRGEFLELLKEKGIGGYGVDLESNAVQFCNDMGLRASQAEAIQHLEELPDDSIDGVFISQVAEHMTPSELIELIGLAYQKMKAGGYVVVETPNPQCLLIFASFFYADLSHVQPIHPETMRFLLLSAGFRDIEIKLTNPVPKSERLSRITQASGDKDSAWLGELNNNLEKLNSVLFGYMDYAAIAHK